MLNLLKNILSFLWVSKKWYLFPLVFILVLFGLVMVFAQGSALAPFIYAIF